MHSFIIVGSEEVGRAKEIEKLLKSWRVNAIDQVYLQSQEISIGIKEIRELQRRIHLKPYTSPYTVAIINDAHLLTVVAQQALLKTLEEPPPTTRIILETTTPDVLLPTILSRCQKITVSGSQNTLKKDHQYVEFINQASQLSPGAKLKLVDAIATDREHAINWIDGVLIDMRQELASYYETKNHDSGRPMKLAKNLARLLLARSQLAANVNPKLVLDHVFLNLR